MKFIMDAPHTGSIVFFLKIVHLPWPMVTPMKKPCDPHGGHDPQVENHRLIITWFAYYYLREEGYYNALIHTYYKYNSLIFTCYK